jgi:hypothetical protein
VKTRFPKKTTLKSSLMEQWMTHSILNRSDARTIDVGLSKNGTQYWGLGIEAFMVAIRGFKG